LVPSPLSDGVPKPLLRTFSGKMPGMVGVNVHTVTHLFLKVADTFSAVVFHSWWQDG
jgi:hypothetical protein